MDNTNIDNLNLFKLVTSEEIVTKVLKDEGDHYVLEKPRLCSLQQEQNPETGQVRGYLVLLPWMMYATDPESNTERDVKLFKNTIAGQAVSVPLVMEKEYLAVTSKIQLV